MARRSATRQQHVTIVWDKGRRPRRFIKSAKARAGVRALQVLLWLLSVLIALGGTLSLYRMINENQPLDPASSAAPLAERTLTRSKAP